ncbi:polyprenyl synthetase family protein [Nocardia aurantia]|uniref:(2E,6E)-farnesyl diphosphate synthase n=1 Tax=Nocardia aurantia TaxID=2585199 RepID=A0A7K0E094_9NOCA|nr:polyprenyl synthetase family protein [Nocardia aurantia]MQY31311.1 (2E,6E)-farnesyl diphosphate synthase [Nocardia aurantia]
MGSHSLAPSTVPAADGVPPGAAEPIGAWRTAVRARVLDELDAFLNRNRVAPLHGIAVDDIARQYVGGGKCLRSSFMYLGWLCGREPEPAAIRAAASLELLHAFALVQDDVMDEAEVRRNRPAAHVHFEQRHRQAGLPGDARRFGESAAVLLGDICLIWAANMLRDSGIDRDALHRVLPRYDAMRTELALGQFADLLNDARTDPDLDTVLAVAAAKSGNYTVRRPLELGAAMADCGEAGLAALSRYGHVVGEAFQLRDDILGVFGAPAVTGKPADSDLGQHKATTVVVAARRLADTATRRELTALLSAPELDAAGVEQLRVLITATGAREHVEAMIDDRLAEAREITAAAPLPESQRDLLDGMADICTDRET